MSLLNLVGINDAVAATTTAGHQSAGGSLLSMLPMMIVFVVVFYFLLVRPQSKRAKEHKKLLTDLAVGDEIATTGGVIGRISKLRDNYIELTVAKDIVITMQKQAISTVLPKGTLETV